MRIPIRISPFSTPRMFLHLALAPSTPLSASMARAPIFAEEPVLKIFSVYWILLLWRLRQPLSPKAEKASWLLVWGVTAPALRPPGQLLRRRSTQRPVPLNGDSSPFRVLATILKASERVPWRGSNHFFLACLAPAWGARQAWTSKGHVQDHEGKAGGRGDRSGRQTVAVGPHPHPQHQPPYPPHPR